MVAALAITSSRSRTFSNDRQEDNASLLKKEPQLPCCGSSGFHPRVKPDGRLPKSYCFTRHGNNKIRIKRSHL